MRTRDLESELAEREAWLDHVPREVDEAAAWVMGEWKRLRKVEAELRERIGALEAEIERLRAEPAREARARSIFRRAGGWLLRAIRPGARL
ncbi:MAG: hypothetical protein ACREQY_02220 [Candidatus Binatia bacterium]